jgi:glycosyltransferase involved in cell wall biosynthesis
VSKARAIPIPSGDGAEVAPQEPRVSVIVPVFDGADTLGVQLEALATQAFDGPWEVIVADNGSRDDSVEVARSYASRLSLRVVDASRVRGAAHARNVGAAAARAPLLAFVDADDAVEPGWLAAIVAALEHHDAVASRFSKTKLNPPELQRSRNLRQSEGLSQHDYVAFLPHAGGSWLVVRRAVHEAIGGFDERFRRLQDTDYSWRLQLAGHAIHFEPAAVLEVRFLAGGLSSLRQAFLYGRYNGWLYRRYRSRGMARAPVLEDLKYVANQVRHLPSTPRGTARAKRLRSIANRLGILVGRGEGRWRV